MTTIDDRATEREEQDRELALRNRRDEGPRPCGHCHYCSETVAAGLRWCDVDCRDDWEAEKRAARERARD